MGGRDDIRMLFHFDRLGKDGHYARNPGSASVKCSGQEVAYANIRLKNLDHTEYKPSCLRLSFINSNPFLRDNK